MALAGEKLIFHMYTKLMVNRTNNKQLTYMRSEALRSLR